MQIDDLKEYFDLFIINYLPHKDKDLYKQVSNFLLDYYYSHTYESIPESFKSAYEQQIIPIDFYDYLLMSNGFPDYLIQKLNIEDKTILLQSFMDFNVYKGTLYSLRKVSDTFNDTFSIYELFVDKDTETNTWVFKPYLVYKNPEVTKVLTESLSWDVIANKTKHFLISKDTLNESDMLLPIKTNLLLLDYHNVHEFTYVMDIYISTILNYFKNYTMILYLKGGEYKTNIITFYRLWYYILNKLYGVSYPAVIGNFTYFDYSIDPFPIDLSDLPQIKVEYDAIKDQATCRAFEVKYFNLFRSVVNNPAIDSTQIELECQYLIPNDLYEYVNTSMESDPTNNIIDELYNSLITWFYSLKTIYDDYKYFFQVFASQLPLIQTKIEDSTTFLLINHLKPYHVELVLKDLCASLKVDDKFNNLYLDYYIALLYKLEQATFAHQSHRLLSQISLNIMESYPIRASRVRQDIKIFDHMIHRFEILNLYKFLIEKISVENISHHIINNLKISQFDNTIIAHQFNVFDGKIIKDGLLIYLDAANIASYPGTGVTWSDLSGNGNNATLTNGVRYDITGLICDGIDDEIVIPRLEYGFPSGGTFEILFYIISTDRDQVFISFSGSIYMNLWMASNNILRWEVLNSTSENYHILCSSAPFVINTWYHVIATFDSNGVYLYINGVLDSDLDNYINRSVVSTDIGYIGDYNPSDYPSNSKLSIVKVYDRALTPLEVSQNFYAIRSRYNIQSP